MTLTRTSSSGGTGVDPMTSRFSDRNAEKDNSCSRPAGGSKGAGKSENFIPAMVLGVWPCSALFRVRVGTLDPKHLTSKNARDGSHQVAEARSPDGEPIQGPDRAECGPGRWQRLKVRDAQHVGADHADLVCEHDGLDPMRQVELCVGRQRCLARRWLSGRVRLKASAKIPARSS